MPDGTGANAADKAEDGASNDNDLDFAASEQARRHSWRSHFRNASLVFPMEGGIYDKPGLNISMPKQEAAGPRTDRCPPLHCAGVARPVYQSDSHDICRSSLLVLSFPLRVSAECRPSVSPLPQHLFLIVFCLAGFV